MRGAPFFDGVSRVELVVGGQPAEVPVFYHDTSAMTALFPARLGVLRRLMPDRRFAPALLAPGVGAVEITCLEHRDTGIGPYNEVAVCVPLNEPWFRPNVPGRALVDGLRRGQAHMYVLHLPVTTEIARRGGIELYNFPKFLAVIDVEEEDDRRVCRLAEGKEEILRFGGPRLSGRTGGEVQYFLGSWMDRQPQWAEFKLNRLEAAATLRPGAASVELGTRHPIARELDRLLLSRRSLVFEHVPRLEAILYGPEHLTTALVVHSLAAHAEATTRTEV